MFNVHMTSTTMDLLPLVCLCLLTWSGTTFVDGNDAAPDPSVKILHQRKDGAILQCDIQGASPKPDVQWQDSDGNTLIPDDSNIRRNGTLYNVRIRIEVKKTDNYVCVVTQKEIDHQTQSAINVLIDDDNTDDTSDYYIEIPETSDEWWLEPVITTLAFVGLVCIAIVLC